MLEGPLRMMAIVFSLTVVVGWALFAIDEARTASRESAAEVAGRQATRSPDPSPRQEQAREAAHGSVREFVDDANDVLLAPFAGLANGPDTDKWTRRTVPMLVALLAYGFGLGFLARVAQGRG